MAKAGDIYKRGDTWWIKYYRDGKPFYESSRSGKEADAKRLLRQRLGQIAEGRFVGLQPERVRFEDLAQDFVNDYRINGKRSLDKAERSVRHLSRVFGGLRAVDITTDKVQAYVRLRLDAGVSNAEINRELAALKRMFNLALRQTPPKVHQKPYVPMLREDNVRTGFFEADAFLKVLEQLPGYLRPVAMLAYTTGWRKEEVLCLTWAQVDVERGTVRLEPGMTKNRDGRLIYLPPALITLVQEQRATTSTLECQSGRLIPWVFHRQGQPIKDFRAAWQGACCRAGYPGALFHDFRRTAVRGMIRAGIPERVAMQITGHKTRSVFDRYHIVSDADLQEAAERQSAYVTKEMVTKTVTIGQMTLREGVL